MTIDFESQEIIDYDDVIQRIKELEAIEVINREPDEQDEIDELYEFADQAERAASERGYGATLIRDDHFEEYVQELARDMGAIADYEGNSWVVIDWEATADNVKTDYSSIEFRGETFWVRS